MFPRRPARSRRRRGLGAVRDWRVAKRKQGYVTVKRLRTRPNGRALGVVVAPVRTTRVPALLRRGGRSFISKNLRGITQTPCPLRRRCSHNQTHRLRMHGRGSVPVSAYEGIEIKHAQGYAARGWVLQTDVSRALPAAVMMAGLSVYDERGHAGD